MSKEIKTPPCPHCNEFATVIITHTIEVFLQPTGEMSQGQSFAVFECAHCNSIRDDLEMGKAWLERKPERAKKKSFWSNFFRPNPKYTWPKTDD